MFGGRSETSVVNVQPYYRDDACGITIYCGDYREVCETLESATIDLILTDPPYGLSGRHSEDAITVEGHAPFVRRYGDWDNTWHPRELLETAHRLLRPGGSLISFLAHEWIKFYSETPLIERKLGAWAKTNPAPRVRPGYQHAIELWTWQVKPGATPTWNGGFTQSNVILSPNAHSTDAPLQHPTQKPLHLMEGFVRRHSRPGDLILDPFMGSGTTLRAAKNLGRRAVGVELEERYCEIAIHRLAQGVFPLVNETSENGKMKKVEKGALAWFELEGEL